MLGLAEEGYIRLVVTDRVAREVPTRMKRLLKARTSEGLEVWRDRYLPLIDVVSVDRHPPEAELAPRVAPVAEADPDDAPTAYLALLCAPCAVLTKDKHLVRHGFGSRQWLTGLQANGRLGEFDRMVHNGADSMARLLGVAGIGGFYGARRVVASPILAGFAIAATFFLLTDGRRIAERGWGRARSGLSRAAEGVGQGVLRLETQRAELLEVLAPYVVQPVPDPPLVCRLAARLARSPEPLSIEALARAERESAATVRTALRAHPAFVVSPGRGWRLGAAA